MNNKGIKIDFKVNIDSFKNGVNQVKTALSDLNKNKPKIKITTDVKEVTNGVKQMVKNVQSGAKSMTKSVKSATSTMGRDFKSVGTIAKGVFTKIGGLIGNIGKIFKFALFNKIARETVAFFNRINELGMNMAEIENLFKVSFGSMTNEAEDFAKSLERAWGVSSTATKQQTAYLNNMIKSMGLTEQQAYGISTSMVQLSHNIASLYDLNQSDVLDKIRSSLVGISKPLLQLGINTKVAQLQQTALKYGIISTNRELTQQERVLATVWAIWEQTESSWNSGTSTINGQKVAIGDMTKTLGSNANMLRVLKIRLTDLGRTWGLAFQPVLKYVIPVLMTLVKYLNEVGKRFTLFIGRLFGMKSIEEIVDQVGSTSASKVDDLGDSFDDATESANKTAKAINNMTGGVDELNILQEPQSASGGGFDTSLGGVENDIGLPDFDTLLDDQLTGILTERIEEIKERLSGLFSEFKVNLPIILALIGGLSAGFLTFKLLLTPSAGGGIGAFFTQFIEGFKAVIGVLGYGVNVFGAFTAPLWAIIGVVSLVVGAFIYLWTTSESFRNRMNEIFSSIGERIGSIFGTIGEYFAIVGNAIAEFVSVAWNSGVGAFFEELFVFVAKAVEIFFVLVDVITKNLLPIFNAVVKVIQPVLNILGVLIGFVASFFAFILENASGFIDFLINVFETDFSGVFTFIADIINGFAEIFAGVMNGISAGIKVVLDFFENTVKPVWNDIWKFIGNLAIGIVNGLISALEWMLNLVVDFINFFVDVYNNSLGEVFKLAGINAKVTRVSSIEFGRIPELASGGIAYGETTAIVGEYAGAKANPEVIAPLNTLRGMLGEQGNNAEEMALMREQNQLLRELLDKDQNLTLDGRELARATQKYTSKLGYNLGSTR